MKTRSLRIFTWVFAIFLLGSVQAPCLQNDPQKGNSFVFVIPSYNNSEWYRDNLDSVFAQTYNNYRIIYIDDASSDSTGPLVKDYVKKKRQEHRVTVLINETRVGALANIYRAIHLCDPHEIIVNLDGDDWLAHHQVLEQLVSVYKNRNVWLTYGQFVYYPGYEPGIGEEIPREVIQSNSFRSFTRGTTALRTFYAGLFQRIKKEDLLLNGKFFQVGYDLAIMLPMLEMAGSHIQFIPDVSYVYNIGTDLNDFKIHFDEQADVDHLVRAKEPYLPLSHYSHDGALKKVYITPGYWGQLFDIHNPIYNRDHCLDVLYQLRDIAREAGYEIIQCDSIKDLNDDFEYLVVFDIFPDQIGYLDRFPKEKLILFLWEPPTIVPENYMLVYHYNFSKVYTWNDVLIDNKKYFKYHIPICQPMIANPPNYFQRRLCTLISCNKQSSHPEELYSQRRKVIEFFDTFHADEFELYGKGWSDMYRTYQGPIDQKVDYLKHYKFCFSYENIKNVPGYVTEKIFDCFQAGCVPIYWGASNITDYVPKNCFIAREEFEDESSLYEFLKNMPPEQYNAYQSNIGEFLRSDRAHLFTPDHFIDMFMHLIKLPPGKNP